VPSYSKAVDENNYHRAKISIEAYDLKNDLFDKYRRRTLKKCNELIKDGNDNLDPANEAVFVKICEDLIEMLAPYSEFTMMTKHRLEGSNLPWIKDYVLDIARLRTFI
jgi:hypothetical protein